MEVGSTLLTFPDANFTPQDFSIMLERISAIKTGILHGCVVTPLGTNSVSVAEGWVAVRGRLVKVEEGSLTFALPATGSMTYYVLLKVDLANTDAPSSVYIADALPQDESEDFNYDQNGIAYCLMATIVTDPLTITQVLNPEVGTEVNYTLLASGWDAGAKTYIVNSELITGTSDQEFLPAVDITSAQLKALQKANIQDAGQTAGSATLKAFGSVPSVDIPIRIKYRGG